MAQPNKEDAAIMSHYPWIVANGKRWGSDGWYIVRECYQSRAMNAPKDTYTINSEGKPSGVDANPGVKEVLEGYVNGTKGGTIANF